MQKLYKIILIVCLFVCAGTASAFSEAGHIHDYDDEAYSTPSPSEFHEGIVLKKYDSEEGDFHLVRLKNNETVLVNSYKRDLPIHKSIIVEYYPDDDHYLYVAPQRNNISLFLLLIFVFAILLLAGVKGLRSLLSLSLSFVLLLLVLVPLLLRGYDPLWLTLGFGLLVLGLSIFMTHGFNKQSLTSFLGSFSSILLAMCMLLVVSAAASLTGVIDESVQFLSFEVGDIVSMSRLISASIIIGILGVLDDITITQVAVVRELSSDKSLTKKNIFKKALRVGRDHISSLVNTLVFAYVGATLPLIMYIHFLDIPLWVLLSQEYIFVEVIRSLIGAIALTVAVPITTWLAVFVFLKGIKKDEHCIESACAHHHH